MDTSSSLKKLLRELIRQRDRIAKLSDGQVAIMDVNDENFFSFVIEVVPNDGPYKDGRFRFAIKVPRRYPLVPPTVRCLNRIYHPNIDDDGDICLSLLDEWDPARDDLESCIQGILFLFHHPNLEDPLSPYFCPEDSWDIPLYIQNVRKSMEGEVVEGFRFEKTLCG